MTGYTREYFLDQFRALPTQDLLVRGATKELVDEAMEAIREILIERGIEGHTLELQLHAALKDTVRRSGVTNQCDFCGANIAFGSLRDGNQRFCGIRCLKEARLLEASVDLARDLIVEHAKSMRYGSCPRCNRQRSIVEMRPYYQIISALWIVHRSTKHELCCRSCGIRNNLFSSISCLLLGWWSIWGLFETPVRVYRNLAQIYKKDIDGNPSPALLYRARLDLTQSLVDAGVLKNS